VPALRSVGLPRREPETFQDTALLAFEPGRPCGAVHSVPGMRSDFWPFANDVKRIIRQGPLKSEGVLD